MNSSIFWMLLLCISMIINFIQGWIIITREDEKDDRHER